MRFIFKLGNLQQRKGHKRSCAQVFVRIAIRARNEDEARAKLSHGSGEIVAWGTGSAWALQDCECEVQP